MSEKQYADEMLSTGEIAKECGVTVRTVQYYDSRGLLVPSELTEGGRRMYSGDDVKKLRFLTYLRSLGLSIDDIGRIVAEDNSGKVLEMLLEEQIGSLSSEVEEKKAKLKEAREYLSMLRSPELKKLGEAGDIAAYMKNKDKMKKIYTVMAVLAAVMAVIELGSVLLWIRTGIWWPFAVGMPIVVALSVVLTVFYYRNVRYICPECHATFKPGVGEFIFSAHTMKARKLTCPRCGKKSFCIETYREEDEK
ncbi:MAG: MerR family transcriptional regulator [Clostridiales bacterium]|nr:MerR family transcriptional regulator [Clostridiales bacterium]